MARRASRHVQLPASDASDASCCRRVECPHKHRRKPASSCNANTHRHVGFGSILGRLCTRQDQSCNWPHARHRVDNIKLHLPRMALALAYKAFPCAVFPFTAQKPVTPNTFRACFTASHHFFNALCAQFFLPRADAALLTIFPLLLLINVSFVKPPTVFAFLPLKTAALAYFPRAMMLTFFTFFIFIAFIDFMEAAFIAFMPFIAAFIAGLRAAFIARAITSKHEGQKRSPRRGLV